MTDLFDSSFFLVTIKLYPNTAIEKGRKDIEMQQEIFVDKWRVCRETNATGMAGGIAEALHGADVCVAFSRPGPGIILPRWIGTMARDAIVFACANPVPEIWPWEAKEAGARIVSTGRSDFPNQVNNSLVFPGIFRGALDVRASTISDGMALAAACELSKCAEERGIHDEDILPKMEQWEVVPRLAAATGQQAQEEGIAKLKKTGKQLFDEATRKIEKSRAAARLLTDGSIIPPVPEEGL